MEIFKSATILILLLLYSLEISAINLKDLIKSVENQDPAIARLYRVKDINLKSSKIFKINPNDTVVFMITKGQHPYISIANPRIYIWSRNDSINFKYSKQGYDIVANSYRQQLWEEHKKFSEASGFKEYEYGLIRPEFYEKELLLSGNIDSIRTLKKFDRICYYSPVSNLIYRFVIHRNKIVKIDHYSYSGFLPPPNQYVDSLELKLREKMLTM
ncbi:MAG: hypothetical protein HDS51_06150 [Barnesiella sp.]|nr:hypothetical protein [Barnesiella sp.]